MGQDGTVEAKKKHYGGPITHNVPDAVRGLRVTLIGYWEGPGEPGWPRVEEFVDDDWDELERDVVASYLEAGFVLWHV
jgi:hypothetical protein